MLMTTNPWQRSRLLAVVGLMLLFLTACDLLGFGNLPTDLELKVTTESNVGAPTLRRLDELLTQSRYPEVHLGDENVDLVLMLQNLSP